MVLARQVLTFILLIYLNYHPWGCVSLRYPQPQVVGNYTYLFNLSPNFNKYWCLNSHLIPNNSDLIG